MDKLQFHFKLLEASDGKSNVLCVTRVTAEDGRTYRIPHDYFEASHHEELIQTPAYNKVKKALKQRNQVRRVWISLDKTLQDIYYDKEGNVQYRDEYLEEITEKQDTSEVAATTAEQPLVKLLEKLLEKSQEKSEDKNIGRLAKEFTIEKFDGKNANANQWITDFEKECERFELTQDEKIIEILKSFMDKTAADWYSCTLLKLTIKTEWKEWKENFCNTFASRGWSPIRYALSYKYQSGSLLEYSIKKEKLLLQVRKTMDNGTLIDLIATGLPNNIIDRIDREKLRKTEDLHNEIGKLEHLIYQKNLDSKKKWPTNKEKNEKAPCKICKENGKGTRYHSEAECWFKDQVNKNFKTKQVNNLTLDVELSEDDPKN